jgi:hypothetical protein
MIVTVRFEVRRLDQCGLKCADVDVPGKEFGDAAYRMVDDAFKHIAEIGLGIEASLLAVSIEM